MVSLGVPFSRASLTVVSLDVPFSDMCPCKRPHMSHLAYWPRLSHRGPICHVRPQMSRFFTKLGKTPKNARFPLCSGPECHVYMDRNVPEPFISVDTLSYLSYTPYYIATINRCDNRGHPIYPRSEHLPSFQGAHLFCPLQRKLLPSTHSLCSEITFLWAIALFFLQGKVPLRTITFFLLRRTFSLCSEKFLLAHRFFFLLQRTFSLCSEKFLLALRKIVTLYTHYSSNTGF